MSDLQIFLMYLAVAILLLMVLGMRRFLTLGDFLERLLGRSPDRDIGQKIANAVASAGQRGKSDFLLIDQRFHASWGMRLVSVGILAVVLYSLWQFQTGGIDTGMDAQSSLIMSGIVLLAAVWSTIYMLTYEIRFEGGMIEYRNWMFMRREKALEGLNRKKDDGRYMLRLYFDDGKVVEILKFVRDRRGMEDILNTAIAANKARNA